MPKHAAPTPAAPTPAKPTAAAPEEAMSEAPRIVLAFDFGHRRIGVACGDSVKHGKPDTSLFQQCLEANKIKDPAQALAVGDTPYDAIAAQRLGMRAVGVLTGGFPERALREAGCEQVFDQVQHLCRTWRPTLLETSEVNLDVFVTTQ